jgi:hypothetical protein
MHRCVFKNKENRKEKGKSPPKLLPLYSLLGDPTFFFPPPFPRPARGPAPSRDPAEPSPYSLVAHPATEAHPALPPFAWPSGVPSCPTPAAQRAALPSPARGRARGLACRAPQPRAAHPAASQAEVARMRASALPSAANPSRLRALPPDQRPSARPAAAAWGPRARCALPRPARDCAQPCACPSPGACVP